MRTRASVCVFACRRRQARGGSQPTSQPTNNRIPFIYINGNGDCMNARVRVWHVRAYVCVQPSVMSIRYTTARTHTHTQVKLKGEAGAPERVV